MSTSSKAKISIETGQTLTTYAKMTDSGDHQIFSLGTIWSGKAGFEPSVRPDGMVAGRNVITPSTNNDQIEIASFTGYSKGALQTITAATDTVTRATGGKAKVTSVTMTSAGAIALVPGLIGSGASFSEERAAAGGPPLIPVSNVEIAQIRTTVNTAGVFPSTQIFQVVGQHAERFDFPSWEEFNVGKGILAGTSAEQKSHIKLTSALEALHVGPAVKDVYVQYYTPVLSELPKTFDHVPAEQSHSVSSESFYNGTIGSSAASLNAGSFTALLTDGVSDSLMAAQDEVITVKFWPDRNQDPYILTQATLGMARTFPVANQNQAAVTMAAENASASFLS